MSKQTNITNFLVNKPAKNTGYLAQLKEEICVTQKSNSPQVEKKRKSSTPIIASPPVAKKQKKVEVLNFETVHSCSFLGDYCKSADLFRFGTE
jgi:hypothetical protein